MHTLFELFRDDFTFSEGEDKAHTMRLWRAALVETMKERGMAVTDNIGLTMPVARPQKDEESVYEVLTSRHAPYWRSVPDEVLTSIAAQMHLYSTVMAPPAVQVPDKPVRPRAKAPVPPKLAARNAAMAKLYAEGKTMREIGEIYGLAQPTVYAAIKNYRADPPRPHVRPHKAARNEEMLRLHENGWTLQSISDLFEVSKQAVSQAIRRTRDRA